MQPKGRQRKNNGGARRDRTDDLMLAKHALSQLSYGPRRMRGEPPAHRPKVMLIFRRRKRNEDGGYPRFVKRQDPTRSVSYVPSVQMPDRQADTDEYDILRKEVIQPQVPLRLPCYDFTPVADPTVVGCLLLPG